jgi:hypothetical protein
MPRHQSVLKMGEQSIIVDCVVLYKIWRELDDKAIVTKIPVEHNVPRRGRPSMFKRNSVRLNSNEANY